MGCASPTLTARLSVSEDKDTLEGSTSVKNRHVEGLNVSEEQTCWKVQRQCRTDTCKSTAPALHHGNTRACLRRSACALSDGKQAPGRGEGASVHASLLLPRLCMRICACKRVPFQACARKPASASLCTPPVLDSKGCLCFDQSVSVSTGSLEPDSPDSPQRLHTLAACAACHGNQLPGEC